MKKSLPPPHTKSQCAVQELARLATNLASSGSYKEDVFWEKQLKIKISAQLRTRNYQNLEEALELLYATDSNGYGEFIYAIEAAIECNTLSYKGCIYDVLMFAAPVLASSRFSIPSGPIPKPILNIFRTQFQTHLLFENTEFSLADYLFSPDQLPRGYLLTHELAKKLCAASLSGKNLHMNPQQFSETASFLSDTRYILGAIAVRQGEPMFLWQGTDITSQIDNGATGVQSSKQGIFLRWKIECNKALRSLFQGCILDSVLPDGFFSAWRTADRLARPYSMHATVNFLQSSLNILASDLHAVIATFYGQSLEEYRISFTDVDSDDVLYGIVWELVGEEDENSDTITQIEITLRECGIAHITTLDNRFPLESCEECGAPLFSNPEGEIVHAEFPEKGDKIQMQLH
jgi:hypothetical protein